LAEKRNLVLASTSVSTTAPYAHEQRRAIPPFVDKQETNMTTTKTRLSALALAAATFTTIALAAGGGASAKILRPFPGHGPVTSIDGKPVGGLAGSEAPPHQFPPAGFHGNSGSSGGLVSCHPVTGCTVTSSNGDHDHDPWYGHDHGGYYGRYYHDRWYGWRDRPEIVVEGVPGAVAVPAPVQAVSAGVSVPAQAAAAPCNCLTKQNLPDGSVLFQDICTKESAIAAPQTVGAR
jgi:hypothetical protein